MSNETIHKPYEIVVLDGLIDGCYSSILESAKKDAKLGDLLKMIELRRKLTPNEEDQKEFWAMLENVRRKHLSKDEAADTPKSGDTSIENLQRSESHDSH